MGNSFTRFITYEPINKLPTASQVGRWKPSKKQGSKRKLTKKTVRRR